MEHGGDERGGGEQHDDYGDNACGERRCGDRDGDGERAERKPGQRVYLHCAADGEQCSAERWVADGRTAVTITGTNFAAGATVKFGSTAATNVVVVSSTSITATTPAGSAGAATVTVTNSNGLSGSLTSGFTYAAPPTVSSVSPNSGSTAGGTAVTITGTNFAAGATVTFGCAATNVAVVNSTTITATTPAGNAGAVTVTVTVNGQSGSLASGFTYMVTAGVQLPATLPAR